jgi:hypothetical protein
MEKIYSIGRVYAIKTHNSDDIYIGSTTQTLKSRLSRHLRDYSKYLIGNVRFISSFDIIKQEKVYIELLEEYEDITRNELFKHEGKYIKAMECVNKIVAGRTRKENYEDNKPKILEKRKEQYEANKEKAKQYQKEHYEANKEKAKQYQREHYEANKEKAKEHQKQYYEANKEKAKEYQKANKERISQKKKEWYQNKKKQQANNE